MRSGSAVGARNEADAGPLDLYFLVCRPGMQYSECLFAGDTHGRADGQRRLRYPKRPAFELCGAQDAVERPCVLADSAVLRADRAYVVGGVVGRELRQHLAQKVLEGDFVLAAPFRLLDNEPKLFGQLGALALGAALPRKRGRAPGQIAQLAEIGRQVRHVRHEVPPLVLVSPLTTAINPPLCKI